MTDVTFTFRIDLDLKSAFASMAAKRDLTGAQLLRQMMRKAVEEHVEVEAHARWQRREIDDAMHEADATHWLNLSNETIEEEWRRRKQEMGIDEQ